MNRYLQEMKNYLRPCAFWDGWLKESGEEPPDFDALPSVPGLPDPLNFLGRKVRSRPGWKALRPVILETFKRFVIGTYPEPPKNIRARTLEQRSVTGGAKIYEVELSFGPRRRARLHLQVLVPAGDNGKFPVFMTQRTHTAWARLALARGYVAVSYDGCDGSDDSQSYREIWPGHDWTRLCRRAWAAGRALDWLGTLPFVDTRHACITGHSRNGKLSLVCGAIDPRFTIVISSSSGVGGATPYRLANEATFGEGIEVITSLPHNIEWFHPRLRFFAGREHKLPVDANLLVALSAPRAVLVSVALNDSCDNVKGAEASVRSAQKVWKLYGCPDRLRVLCRWGEHDTTPGIIERYLDFCDLHSGKAGPAHRRRLKRTFAQNWLFPYDYKAWRRHRRIPPGPVCPFRSISGPTRRQWEQGRSDRIKRIYALLGEGPPAAPGRIGDYGLEKPYKNLLLSRPMLSRDRKVESYHFAFGDYLPAALYLPRGAFRGRLGTGLRLPHNPPLLDPDAGPSGKNAKKLPLVIWLSPDSVSCGYAGAYVSGSRHFPEPVARAGFAVMAYDHIGNGGRVEEAGGFYHRYPRWSLLGKMVHDARAAVDAACSLRFIDRSRIFLVGFGTGATVALLAAAVDRRVSGVASVCGFTPFRTDTSDRPTGGIARYALWDGGGLLPLLGMYASGRAAQIPIDFDEILGHIAPRPLLCVTPTLDREANHGDCLACLHAVKEIYDLFGAGERLWHYAPVDHRRFPPQLQARLYRALRAFI